ncbi:hypothetical protein HOH11_02485 [Candidatus Woesearchaeota archaeon]|jgi:flagellin-like protein|nr:hypothetical protein [Candidatus Woesearchaeota archaeon]MBT6023442.1 hypothetical protein [Candidatus Woesearchaeota archaeon]
MRKGVSEVVSIILLIVMVMVAAGSFFYWYSSGQDDAQIQAEMHQTNVFDQINSRTSALIDAAYSVNREVNINNFAEYVTQICADEKSINLAADELRLEIYEGYGAGTELICAVRDFSGECNTNVTTLFGVLGGSSASVTGMYTVSSTDGGNWTTSSISSEYNSYSLFNFTYLDGFNERGNSTRNPENMLLMGTVAKPAGSRKAILSVLDRTLKGNSYGITDLDENVTIFHSAEMVREIPGVSLSLFRGGALTDPLLGDPKTAIITKQFAAYDVPERLTGFGLGGRNIVNSKVTALREIVRMGQTQLLIGTTGSLDEGAAPFIDETQDLTVGIEVNYENPGTVCPYDIPSFSQCGITIDPVGCGLTIEGVPAMLHVPEFTNSSKVNSDPIFIAINNLTNSSGNKFPSVFWTGQNQENTELHCIDLMTAGVDPSYNIVEMKYHQNSNQVMLFLTARIGAPGFQVIGIRDSEGNYNAELISPPVGSGVNPLTFDFLGDNLYLGGTNGTHGTITKFNINSGNGNFLSETRVYQDNTYPEVQKLFSYTACTERQPACVTGCNQILKKGDCTLLNISIEDSSCDISKYSPGTKFTVKTANGKYFEKLEIFTKSTGVSSEVNSTEVS